MVLGQRFVETFISDVYGVVILVNFRPLCTSDIIELIANCKSTNYTKKCILSLCFAH